MDWGALAASVLASVITITGGALVARRFKMLGGDKAQGRLNVIREELDIAMSQKVRLLEDELAKSKERIAQLEVTVRDLRRERLEMQLDMDALHEELRKIRVDRHGAKDRSSD